MLRTETKKKKKGLAGIRTHNICSIRVYTHIYIERVVSEKINNNNNDDFVLYRLCYIHAL